MIKTDIPQLDQAGLRKFGLTTAAIIIVLFGLLLPVYRGWMRVGMLLGFINTHIILFLLYYLIFLPLGLVIRLVGRDAMARSMTAAPGDSYRVVSAQRDHRHFERPY